MEANDIMTYRALEGGMSPYEQFKVGYMQQKHHTSGIGVAGLVLGTVGTAAAVGAWIFGPLYGNAKANQAKEAAYAAKELAAAQNQSLRDIIGSLANTVAAERAERIAGDVTLTNTVNDSVSGSQQGTLTAQQAAELSAIQTATNTVTTGLMTGQYSQNPQKVALYRDATQCGCPATGCGCGYNG